MSDISTVWSAQAGVGDWVFVPNDLQGGDDLETSVLLSLFTDRRAEDSDVIPDAIRGQPVDRRGWWGDLDQDYPIGSRMWLLDRAKQITQTLLDAKAYCVEALAWLIVDGVAGSVTVDTSWIFQGAIGIVIVIYDADGNQIAKYSWAWNGLS